MASMKRQKTGRPRSENPMKHTGIVLPLDLLERLKDDARRSGRGLATEIRHRLQQSFDQEEERSRHPEMTALVEGIKKLADSLYRDVGVQWHRHKFSRDALKAGIAVFLSKYDAEDERAPDMPFTGYPDDAPPDVVGQTHARLILRSPQENE